MGWTNSGMVRQEFEIKLDISRLIDYITDRVCEEVTNAIGNCDLDESYVEDYDELIIKGSYDTDFKHWYCRATLESPEENEYERKYIDTLFLNTMPETIKGLVSVKEIKEDEEKINYDI